MPLASLRCRSARFDEGRLNQKVKIATLKNECVLESVVVSLGVKVGLSILMLVAYLLVMCGISYVCVFAGDVCLRLRCVEKGSGLKRVAVGGLRCHLSCFGEQHLGGEKVLFTRKRISFDLDLQACS